MNKIENVMRCLDTLSQAAQDEIRDKLMISSENEWHDVKQLYKRFEDEDLAFAGYIHESEIVKRAVDDIEGLCYQLAKEKQPQTIISIDMLAKLYKKEQLTDDDSELVEAILQEAGEL